MFLFHLSSSPVLCGSERHSKMKSSWLLLLALGHFRFKVRDCEGPFPEFQSLCDTVGVFSIINDRDPQKTRAVTKSLIQIFSTSSEYMHHKSRASLWRFQSVCELAFSSECVQRRATIWSCVKPGLNLVEQLFVQCGHAWFKSLAWIFFRQGRHSFFSVWVMCHVLTTTICRQCVIILTTT